MSYLRATTISHTCMHRSRRMYRSHDTHHMIASHVSITSCASISSHVSHALIASHTCMHRSHHMYRSHHMHRSHRIHACIDRITCIDRIAYMHASITSYASIESHDRITRIDRIACVDHIIYTIATHACMHRSHNLTTIDHPPGIENSRYSLFRTPPCFDTGGHRCQGLHIRCQSDSTDIDKHVASLRATAPHPSQPLLYLKAVLVPLHSSIGK